MATCRSKQTGIRIQPFGVCVDCARKKGGRWKLGHVATFWKATCFVCGKIKSVCAVSDWTLESDARKTLEAMCERYRGEYGEV